MLVMCVHLCVWCGKRARHAEDCRAQQSVEDGGEEWWQEQAESGKDGVIDGP